MNDEKSEFGINALTDIKAKCEQYWNEGSICAAEVHNALECIHRWANEALAEIAELRSQVNMMAAMGDIARRDERLTCNIELQAKDAEIERLTAGRFTPEEFQNLCHNLPEGCTREVFERGCKDYQDRLFGKATTTEAT